MMGRKKGREAPAPAPAPAPVPDAQTSCEDVSTQRDAAQINAPKVYSFSSGLADVNVSNKDGRVLKLVVPPDLEKRIREMINQRNAAKACVGTASFRLSAKKLQDVYQSLHATGFNHEHIDTAMTATLAYGGDLRTALDWLCLNLPDDSLPEGLVHELTVRQPNTSPLVEAGSSSKLVQEQSSQKKGKTKVRGVDNGSMESTERKPRREQKFRYSLDGMDPDDRYLMLAAKLLDERERGAEAVVREDLATKRDARRCIRSLLAELHIVEKDSCFNKDVQLPGLYEPFEWEKEDVVAALMDSNEAASEKVARKQHEKKNLHKKDEAIETAIEFVETTVENEECISINSSPTEKADKMTTHLAEGEERKAVPKESTGTVDKGGVQDVRIFEYSKKNWTAKSPKQFLIDWCRKHLPRSPAPSFHKVPAGQYWRARARVDRQKEGGLLEVCPTILCEDSMQAQHLAATLALWHLCRGQSIHQLLPPPYRSVWLEWKAEDAAKAKQAVADSNRPRDVLIARLQSQLKHGVSVSNQAVKVIDKSNTATSTGYGRNSLEVESELTRMKCKTEEPRESWEDCISDEDDEGMEDVQQLNTNVAPEIPALRSVCHRSNDLLAAARTLYANSQASARASRLKLERQALPVWQHREAIMEALHCHKVLVVAGETGSGKSTQVPQLLLEDFLSAGANAGNGMVVCTQPRRISAITLARRVNEELGCPDEPGGQRSLVGYQVRLERAVSSSTRLLYCTAGVLLRKLQLDPEQLAVTHVVLDEVHERSVQSDFLLLLLRLLRRRRPDLHLLLMSATADCAKFSSYLGHCPVVSVPGRTHPVQIFYLEDVVEVCGYTLNSGSSYGVESAIEETDSLDKIETSQPECQVLPETSEGLDQTQYSTRTLNTLNSMNQEKVNPQLIVKLLQHIESTPALCSLNGAVLVFLPGMTDIQELHNLLKQTPVFRDPKRYLIVGLHSALSSREHDAAFAIPLHGVRKIVLSTNIAETGVTIPDVVFVVDSGRVKQNCYNEGRQLSVLAETFVSKASAAQRQGRAGRVRPGICYRLYTRAKYESLVSYTTPEIQRIALEELCLHIMKCKMGDPYSILSEALDSPSGQAIGRAMAILRSIGACQPKVHLLTPLGHHLASLPLPPRLAKMLIFGAICGYLIPAAAVAAAVGNRSPFVTPIGKRVEANRAKLNFQLSESDHLTVYKAYQSWHHARQAGERAEIDFCHRSFLHRSTLIEMEGLQKELIKLMEVAGFSDHQSNDMTSRPAPNLSEADVLVLKVGHSDSRSV
uniref:ATP-dependent RNA helicase DHX29-like isoform X3 n=1 Tax=Myxine glutinosa TaxID=7769 RepID=UPI00358ED397